MVLKFTVTDVTNRKDALKKARSRVSRLNKDPRGFKGDERVLISLKLSPTSKTLGGRKVVKGTFFIATTKKKRRSK